MEQVIDKNQIVLNIWLKLELGVNSFNRLGMLFEIHDVFERDWLVFQKFDLVNNLEISQFQFFLFLGGGYFEGSGDQVLEMFHHDSELFEKSHPFRVDFDFLIQITHHPHLFQGFIDLDNFGEVLGNVEKKFI